VAALGEEAQQVGFKLCNKLRMEGIKSEMDYAGKSLKSQMKRADKLGCRFTMIIGDNEITGNQAVLRNMKESIQSLVELNSIESIKKVIKGEESIA
jgi:histidyl-tRNA synthetase